MTIALFLALLTVATLPGQDRKVYVDPAGRLARRESRGARGLRCRLGRRAWVKRIGVLMSDDR